MMFPTRRKYPFAMLDLLKGSWQHVDEIPGDKGAFTQSGCRQITRQPVDMHADPCR
jgi:hypothetical protein